MPVPGNLPQHGKDIFERVMGTLKGKKNPRTGKPYTDEERAKIAWNAVKNKYHKIGEEWQAKTENEIGFDFISSELMEFKAENGKHFFKGYLSTFDVDLVNDLVTPECMKDMLNQINSGLDGHIRSMKGSPDHDVFWTQDTQRVPISKLTSATIDNKGLFVEGMFNPDHPEFKTKWNEIQNGFLDGLSIEYKPTDFAFKDIDGKKVRVLNKVLLKGYGHTPRPANPYSTLTDCFVKSLEIKDMEEMMEEDSMKKKITNHLKKDIQEHEMMMNEDNKFLEEIIEKKDEPYDPELDDEDENTADKKKEELKVEEKIEVKAESQPAPQTEIKSEPKVETKAETIDIKSLKEEIKAIVKEELKSLIPEKKDLPDSSDKFEEAKSLDLVGYVTKQLGGR